MDGMSCVVRRSSRFDEEPMRLLAIVTNPAILGTAA
jgi:hypothetical protein